MNSKERVLQSFNHHAADRLPRDFLAVLEINVKLMEHFKVSDYESLLKALGVDFRHLDKWGNMIPKYVGPPLKKHADGITEDYWGLRVKRLEYAPGCFYEKWVDPPLAGASSIRDIEKHPWPRPDWFDFSAVPDYCQKHNNDCLAGGLGATFDMVGFFRGMEQGMLDIYDNPVLMEAIIEKLFEFKYEYNLRMLQAAGGRMDILFVSEDMGSQNGLIVSKETLQRFVFPCLKKFALLAHKYNAMLMLHSDGDISEIIPGLIELGVDIINPVQATGPSMDIGRLKKLYGKELCFHGLLDSQQFLPQATPEEIIDQIRFYEKLAGNGGIALSPNCGFQIDVPLDNILAVYGRE